MMACEVYVFILDSEKFYSLFSFNVNIFERNCSLFVLEQRNEENVAVGSAEWPFLSNVKG
jgi:hypothetical protein